VAAAQRGTCLERTSSFPRRCLAVRYCLFLIQQGNNNDKRADYFDAPAAIALSCANRGNTGSAIVSQNGPPECEEGSRPTVFFSYSRVDFAKAQPIIELLEASGFAVWWDGKLEAGVKYVESTEHALETAQAVIVAWSSTSVASHWVRDEAMGGRDTGRLIPLSLDGTLPPLGFRQFQVLDFAGWNGRPDAGGARELLRATAAMHGMEAVPRAAPRPRAVTANRRQTLLYLGLGAGALAAGGLAYSLFLAGDDSAGVNSIAVLPFANDSPDQAQDYLSSGLAAELRSMLARNLALRVVARSSSEVVMERGMDAVAAARELGVVFIVEGSIRVVGDAVRVTSELIDGETGIGRWSKTYNETLGNLLTLQEDLAQSISSELSAQVGLAQGALMLGQASVPAAFDEYLKGWALLVRSSDTATDLAVLGHFQNAARLDTGFAGARAGEAAAFLALGHTAERAEAASGYYDNAVAAAQQAVVLGPDLAEAHSVLAQTLFEAQLKVTEARPAYERSLERGAGSAAIQARYAEYEALTGHPETALPAIERAMLLDPLNPAIFKSAGLVHYAAGDYAAAIAMNLRALELDPDISGSHAWIASSLLQSPDLQAALRECQMEPYAAMRLAGLAIIQHRLGNMAAATAAMAELVAEYGDAVAYQQAQVLAQWGEADAALEKLALARELGDAGLTYLLIDPMLEPLRGRAGFNALLQGLGFS